MSPGTCRDRLTFLGALVLRGCQVVGHENSIRVPDRLPASFGRGAIRIWSDRLDRVLPSHGVDLAERVVAFIQANPVAHENPVRPRSESRTASSDRLDRILPSHGSAPPDTPRPLPRPGGSRIGGGVALAAAAAAVVLVRRRAGRSDAVPTDA